MKYIKRAHINVEKWDACIKASTSLVYPYSWYLDEICENWDALILEEDELYVACFPVPWKKKYGIKYVYPPFFIQQLGVFTADKGIQAEPFFTYLIDHFRWVELYVKDKIEGLTPRCNMVLPLHDHYDQLKANYSSNHRRNLKKATNAQWSIEKANTANKVIELFRRDKGKQYPALNESTFFSFSKICDLAFLKEQFVAYHVLDSSKEVVCGALFFVVNKRITFVFSGNSEQGRKGAALFMLLDHIVKTYQNTHFTLDFEGSEDAGLRRFYKGFGAVRQEYYFFKKHQLPFPLNLIKK